MKFRKLSKGLVFIVSFLFVFLSNNLAEAQWNLDVVDSNENVGLYTSLALDSSGNPHISYYDYANDDLKYAFKGDLDGAEFEMMQTTAPIHRMPGFRCLLFLVWECNGLYR